MNRVITGLQFYDLPDAVLPVCSDWTVVVACCCSCCCRCARCSFVELLCVRIGRPAGACGGCEHTVLTHDPFCPGKTWGIGAEGCRVVQPRLGGVLREVEEEQPVARGGVLGSRLVPPLTTGMVAAAATDREAASQLAAGWVVPVPAVSVPGTPAACSCGRRRQEGVWSDCQAFW